MDDGLPSKPLVVVPKHHQSGTRRRKLLKRYKYVQSDMNADKIS